MPDEEHEPKSPLVCGELSEVTASDGRQSGTFGRLTSVRGAVIITARTFQSVSCAANAHFDWGKPGFGMSSVRVLVAEDFAPFRRFLCTMLAKNPEWQVVGEASDGLEAVHKAEELQPDLITLDLGLPTLNGIEAAREIRKLAPGCKILFLSQESSTDLVQEALRSGALGYVLKAQAGIDLRVAVEAVLEGRQFVSSGLQIAPNSV